MEANIAHRRRVAETYQDLLARLGGSTQTVPAYATHGYLRFPIFVTDREEFVRRGRRARLEVGDWFRSPLHPVEERLDRWGYEHGQAPVAERLSRSIVNLPTDRGISDDTVEQVCAFVTSTRDLLA
jgi:perosamine synthetase